MNQNSKIPEVLSGLQILAQFLSGKFWSCIFGFCVNLWKNNEWFASASTSARTGMVFYFRLNGQ